ncbi:hypothetical protein [Aliidiomarina quisquiliarum]|uniref:hypothetical protein n=1 Tax=Aliidiomarina quisquiliarum TaxID=2938947 RepID=UPI00208F8089|nr:hypothetical protein [Aliidiomarina quisquiliarum]MCO4320011.1 hypothetical protein [Aliidiomarina quisquiliarum]
MQLEDYISELGYSGFEAWDFGEDKIYLSLATIPSGGKIQIVATGEDMDATVKHWKITGNHNVSDEGYRHVELKHVDGDKLEFSVYPVNPSPYPTSILSGLKVLEKNGGGELWAICQNGNGQLMTFFKKNGIFDHWVVAQVNSALNSLNERVNKKLKSGYTEVGNGFYFDAEKRIVCYANGTEV